ncbi:2771_t:CDS:1, partial [Acaulospora morrowiae]
NQNLQEWYPTSEEQRKISQLIILLEPMEKETQFLCATNYPTLALIRR